MRRLSYKSGICIKEPWRKFNIIFNSRQHDITSFNSTSFIISQEKLLDITVGCLTDFIVFYSSLFRRTGIKNGVVLNTF